MDWRALSKIPSYQWPEGADAIIADIIRDKQTSDQDLMLACELAGELVVMNDELARELLRVAQNPDHSPDARGHAEIALGPALEEFEMTQSALSEEVFEEVQAVLRKLQGDPGTPALVRRRALEASVRAPMDWHTDAIRAAYASDEVAWKVTAVFCMGFVNGFDKQIFEALESPIPDLKFEAVNAARNSELEAAWPQIQPLLRHDTEKELLLAAIGAAAVLRPDDAQDLLAPLADTKDPEISAEIKGALSMARAIVSDDYDDEDDED
jgi:hypothetical protein